MSLFMETELRARADRVTTLTKTADAILTERVQLSSSTTEFDIFLSHSFTDHKLVLGIWLTLEDMGYRVYVDWIHDRSLSRDRVTKETARVLRQRMSSSKCLFYATTNSSSSSKWMPWELGFKDGDNGRSAILPVTQSPSSSYKGQEYLGIYPYVDQAGTQDKPQKKVLWVRTSPTCYVLFDSWLKGVDPYERS